MFFGPKVYELPLARNYVAHWGLAEAVREILQNALDSDSPFDVSFDFEIEEDPWSTEGVVTHRATGIADFTVRSRNARLSAASLLLGATTKADAEEKIGSFGEGYKIALLVLTRAGYRVRVNNGDVVWRPEFRPSKQFGGAETLHIVEEPGRADAQGVEFVISGLTPADRTAIVASCLQMQGDAGEAVKTSRGRILLERPGKLYVGGLFVCDTKMKYGYDVLPQHLKLERDRQTVSGFDLAWLAKEMWFESQRIDDVVKMLEEEAPDMEYAEYGAPEVVKEACYRAFRANHPDKLIAKSKDDLADAVRGAMTVYMGGSYGKIVSGSASYRAEKFTRVVTPQEHLQDFFRSHRSDMRTPAIVAFKQLIASAAKWSVK